LGQQDRLEARVPPDQPAQLAVRELPDYRERQVQTAQLAARVQPEHREP
jgi:hypothetical protein